MTDDPTPDTLVSTFVAPETHMLNSVITQIDGTADLTPTRLRDLKSALNTIARLSDKVPNRVPANVNWLSIRLRHVSPAAHNMSAKRFKNIKSDAIRALALAGCSRARADGLWALAFITNCGRTV